jgi:hypothetical protein
MKDIPAAIFYEVLSFTHRTKGSDGKRRYLRVKNEAEMGLMRA